jgi:hypothetical protein
VWWGTARDGEAEEKPLVGGFCGADLTRIQKARQIVINYTYTLEDFFRRTGIYTRNIFL